MFLLFYICLSNNSYFTAFTCFLIFLLLLLPLHVWLCFSEILCVVDWNWGAKPQGLTLQSVCQGCFKVLSVFLFGGERGLWGDGGVGVVSGGAIINIRSCRETKGLKWKGLAGWGDLAMSCTSVIFLVRLELSQGFNWNPDFKESFAPSSSSPPHPHPWPFQTPPLLYLHLSCPQHIHTERDHYYVTHNIAMYCTPRNWLIYSRYCI